MFSLSCSNQLQVSKDTPYTSEQEDVRERVRERVARERNEEPSEKELGGLCQQQEGGVLSGWLRAY